MSLWIDNDKSEARRMANAQRRMSVAQRQVQYPYPTPNALFGRACSRQPGGQSRLTAASALASFTLLCGLVSAAEPAEMTYEQARSQLTERQLPPFWTGDVAGLPTRWKQLKRGHVDVIATSPGGRPLHLISYGQHEKVRHRANFNSAVGGRDPSAYMDKAARKKPVLYFVGPVHGHEVEGLTGLVNLIRIMETGCDLRGRDQSQLRQLGEQCRLLIVPAGNPDGIARFEPRAAYGMKPAPFQFWGMGTWSDNTIAIWPTSKLQHPRKGPEIGYMGCYFNDAGINPMHDEFLAPMGPEAPAILKTAMREGPDLAVSLHSHESHSVLLRPAYVPLEKQQEVIDLAQQCYALFDDRGLPHGKPFTATSETGDIPAPFNLVSALYHISGATAFTFECPHGIDDEKACHVTLDQILDIQLSLYEAMMRFALAKKQH